jgi:hypothetical protein
MRPLRYSINVTLDGCCDHHAIVANEELHRHAAANLAQADALLFGRVTYEMMEAAFRPPARAGVRHGPTLFAGLSKRVDLKLVSRLEFGSGKHRPYSLMACTDPIDGDRTLVGCSFIAASGAVFSTPLPARALPPLRAWPA